MAYTVRSFERMQDAASALSADRSARYLGGGTLVMRAVNEGDQSFGAILRSTDAALKEIRASGQRIEIGAGATMAEILAHRDLAFLHPVASAIGGPAIRNMGTVGGNLFAPTPYGDFTAALLALDAVVVEAGHSRRETPLPEFLSRRGSGSPSLVSGVTLARPSAPDAFRFVKVSRVKPKGIAVLSIAAHLPMSGGRLRGPRVAYGARAPTPVRALALERALEGKALTEPEIEPALGVALDGASPATDAIATEWYRRQVLPVHLKRLLLGRA